MRRVQCVQYFLIIIKNIKGYREYTGHIKKN